MTTSLQVGSIYVRTGEVRDVFRPDANTGKVVTPYLQNMPLPNTGISERQRPAIRGSNEPLEGGVKGFPWILTAK